jgi:hypothetical protein
LPAAATAVAEKERETKAVLQARPSVASCLRHTKVATLHDMAVPRLSYLIVQYVVGN